MDNGPNCYYETLFIYTFCQYQFVFDFNIQKYSALIDNSLDIPTYTYVVCLLVVYMVQTNNLPYNIPVLLYPLHWWHHISMYGKGGPYCQWCHQSLPHTTRQHTQFMRFYWKNEWCSSYLNILTKSSMCSQQQAGNVVVQ